MILPPLHSVGTSTPPTMLNPTTCPASLMLKAPLPVEPVCKGGPPWSAREFNSRLDHGFSSVESQSPPSSRAKMKRSLAAAIAASFSRLGAGRPLSVVVKARPSLIDGGATTISVRLPDAPKPTTCGKKPASTPRLSQHASAGGETLAKKVRVSLRFDAALLARVSESAKRQGITRTSWLHRAAFDALGDSHAPAALRPSLPPPPFPLQRHGAG
jgi:hypothetical protein